MLCPDCFVEMEEGCVDNYFCPKCGAEWELTLTKKGD